MKWVIDSSVAIKWFIIEEGREDALALVYHASLRGYKLIAPDFILIEVANILWKKGTKNEVTDRQARDILSDIPTYFDELMLSRHLLDEAQKLSQTLNHPIYDCLYLAAASKANARFITADAKLYHKVLEKNLAISLHLLSKTLTGFLSD